MASQSQCYLLSLMLESYYRCLFDRGQQTCFGETHKSVRVSPVRLQTQKPFLTINALDPKRDHHPTEPYHSANLPRRADHNVICLRNILLEMDSGSAAEQMKAIGQSEIPWSTCVSSGGKSLHFIICLQDALTERLAYSKLVKQIYAGLQQLQVNVDTANKNPSRFSRAPGVTRPETGRLQKLIAVEGRVANQTLEQWISKVLPPAATLRAEGNGGTVLPFLQIPRMYASTEQFLKYGAPAGEWNSSLFRAACNLFQVGISREEAVSRLQGITGTLDASDLATIRSAQRRVGTATGS